MGRSRAFISKETAKRREWKVLGDGSRTNASTPHYKGPRENAKVTGRWFGDARKPANAYD
jgi:hypothetical protein